jgi:3D (Asp-Asp-Asp) domain-containing protein
MCAKTICTNLYNVQVGDHVTVAYPSGDERFGRVSAVDEGTFCVGSRVYVTQAEDFATSGDLSGCTAYAMLQGQEDEL